MSEPSDTKITALSDEDLEQVSGGDATADQVYDIESAQAADNAYKAPADTSKG